jgi:chromosome partitioning protein
VVSNQRGGVGKTTTVITLARCLADRGKRVLIVDTDSQGSIWMSLGLKPTAFLHQFINEQYAVSKTVTTAHPSIDVICSDRRTMGVEGILNGAVAREMIFYSLLKPAENLYDVILFDVAPSITHLQSCAMAYAQNVLVPVAMDALSTQGAMASLQTISLLNEFFKLNCRCVGFLPTMVDQRLSATDMVLTTLRAASTKTGIAVMHGIRTDQAINKALRSNKFLQDYDPKSRALEDYNTACEFLLSELEHGAATAAS